MGKPIIVIPGKVRQEGIDELKKHVEVREWQEVGTMPRDLLKEWLKDADGLWATKDQKVDKDLLNNASNLKVVVTASVGYDHINVNELTELGIPVGNTPGVLTETVAEFAFSLILTARRRIYENIQYVFNNRWKDSDSLVKGPIGRDVSRQTLGIIGMGKIGLSVSRRARAFGMTVIYHNRHPRKDDNLFMTKYVPLDDLLSQSDVVLVTAPLNNDTYHMVDAAWFKKMKNSALFVNIGRGRIVETGALVEALTNGEIDYAALDVTDPEPISADHELIKTGRCIVTPHIASYTNRCRTDMALLAVENLLKGVYLEPLTTCVNSEVNYTNKK